MKRTLIVISVSLLLSFLPSSLQLNCIFAREAPAAWSERVARNFISRYPDPDVIHWNGQSNHFTWQAGYIMFAMEKLWRQTNDSTYFNYIRRYVDQNVDSEGNVPNFTPSALDNFIPGYACLLMYEQTGEQRYARAAETIRRGFDTYPRMDDGAAGPASGEVAGWMFHHSKTIPQVWVDGVFMGQIFLARYARTMHHPEDFKEVVRQMEGIEELCGRPDGLLYHAYLQNGHSPEVWSEGLGWCAVLFSDIFDYLPEDIDGRDRLMEDLRRMCKGLKDSQDPATGMWCQVVDKPGAAGNWNETSGTGMFLYLLQNSISKGYISASDYQGVVDRAYDGILKKVVVNADGFTNLIDCSSIGVKRSYEEYIRQPHEISTFAAYGSFIIGTAAVEHSFRHAVPGIFYATDYTQGKIFRFRNGAIEWQHDAPLSNDLQLLDNGNILFTTGDGVLELNSQDDTVFRYKASCHVFACQRLKDGNTFIGECENGRLLEVNPKGRIVHQVNILHKIPGTAANGRLSSTSASGSKADMAFMRNAIRLDNGHYLVAHYGPEKVVEYDHKGNAVWSVDTPGRAHSVIRLPNGNTIVSIADAGNNPLIVEFNPQKEIVWQLTNRDLPGSPLRFMSGMQYVEGLGLFITNWQGHRGAATQPHIFLVTKDKHLHATFPPSTGIQTISNIYVAQQQ